ncbi:MAG: ROK family protein [Acidimicrobiaceae bacterium]|nr:ROK family protein [Acidimicrobiaceae bacterium]MBO0747177.1 ROK family protein [Acidimicrobiaceae bacterium]
MDRFGFGVDIGGSGVKGAVVDLVTGALQAERVKVPTPKPSTPELVAAAVAEVVRRVGWDGPIGATFPAVVVHGVAQTAANVDSRWIGTDVEKVLAQELGQPVLALNDADAAGVAEARFGAAKDRLGLVIVTTLGTGIGTALLYNGTLIPNSELGHIELGGIDAEKGASSAAKERESLSWERWAKRLQKYYTALEDYLNPQLFVVGGGVSRKSEKFLPLLKLRTPIVAATEQNEAGIVGAAMVVSEAFAG